MVKQGSILKVNLSPTKGHEQKGYRPILIVSGNQFNSISNDMVLACPITNSNHKFPLHIPLDSRSKTTGVIIVDQIKAVDLTARGYKFIENAPKDIVNDVVKIINQIITDN